MDVNELAGRFLLLRRLERRRRERFRRSCWVRPILLRRDQMGEYHTLVKEMREVDPAAHHRYFRMSVGDFDELLGLVSHTISKQTTNMRDPISPGERLAVTLRFLAAGGSMKAVAESYRIGYATIRKIVPEVCEAIWSELGPAVLAFPDPSAWREMAKDFGKLWQFPNCVGSLDGKHVMVEKPANSGSLFYNYKGFCSVVLMAVVDAHYRFSFISVGGNGQESDGGVWSVCDLSRMLEEQLNGAAAVLPEPQPLPGTDTVLPHVLVGDEAFPLRPFLMRPFPGSQLNPARRIGNYRMSRARLTCENAFGILAQRWRIFRAPIGCSVEAVRLMVQATCVLHNYLRSKDMARRETRPGSYSRPRAEERGEVAGLVNIDNPGAARHPTAQAVQVRDAFVHYFNGVGSVTWQQARVDRAAGR